MPQWFSFRLLRKRISKAANHSWCLHFWMPSLRHFKSMSILKKCQNITIADNQAPFRHFDLCNKKQRQPKSLLIYENLGFSLLKAYITFENWVHMLLKMLPIKILFIAMNKCFSLHTNHTRWVAMTVLLYHQMVLWSWIWDVVEKWRPLTDKSWC